MQKILATSSLMMGALIFTQSVIAVELDITPSGFVDFVWTLSDGSDLGKNGDEGQFNTSGEIDIEGKLKEGFTLRIDADINPSTADSDSASLEQIYLKWEIAPKLSLTGGVFNNKLTFEKEDAPELYQITHGQLWDIWSVSTAEGGNNLQGVELNYQFSQVNLIVGYLNDLDNTPEKNSLEVAAEISVAKDLDITLGLITQDRKLETIFDIFASYKINKWLFAGEIMIADEQVDNGFMVMTNYKFTNKVSATARYDIVSYEDTFLTDNTSSLTIAGLYSISQNIFANAELRFNNDDNSPTDAPLYGEGDGTTARLELIATF